MVILNQGRGLLGINRKPVPYRRFVVIFPLDQSTLARSQTRAAVPSGHNGRPTTILADPTARQASTKSPDQLNIDHGRQGLALSVSTDSKQPLAVTSGKTIEEKPWAYRRQAFPTIPAPTHRDQFSAFIYLSACSLLGSSFIASGTYHQWDRWDLKHPHQCGRLCSFPAPGGPRRISCKKLTYTNPLLYKTFILPHDELRFNLLHRVNRYPNGDQETCTAKPNLPNSR